jgi:hypothetical protein
VELGTATAVHHPRKTISAILKSDIGDIAVSPYQNWQQLPALT